MTPISFLNCFCPFFFWSTLCSLRVKIQVCTLWLMKQRDSVLLYEFDAWLSLFRGPYWQEFQLHFSFPLRCQIIRTIEQEHLKSFFLSSVLFITCHDFSVFVLSIFFSSVIFVSYLAGSKLQNHGMTLSKLARRMAGRSFLPKFGSIMPHQISGWSNHLHCFLFDKSMSRKSRCAKWKT